MATGLLRSNDEDINAILKLEDSKLHNKVNGLRTQNSELFQLHSSFSSSSFSFCTFAVSQMLISYNNIRGIVQIIWLITSGGVIIPAKIKMITIAYFRLRRRKSGLIKPTFARKNITNGN